MKIFMETERLVLRELTPEDAAALENLDADPEVLRFLADEAKSASEIEQTILPRVLSYYERWPGFGYWAALVKPELDFVGWFHFRPPLGSDQLAEIELGFRLMRSAWGDGLATEGSRALIDSLEGRGRVRIVAKAHRANLASIRVLEKSGLRLESEGFDSGLPIVRYALELANSGPGGHDS